MFNFQLHNDPEFIDLMMEATRDKMLENPNMTEEMVDKAMAMMEKFMNPLVGTRDMDSLKCIFRVVYSLIGGLVMKKEQE